jgi:hypothetical protein
VNHRRDTLRPNAGLLGVVGNDRYVILVERGDPSKRSESDQFGGVSHVHDASSSPRSLCPRLAIVAVRPSLSGLLGGVASEMPLAVGLTRCDLDYEACRLTGRGQFPRRAPSSQRAPSRRRRGSVRKFVYLA